MSPSDSSPHIGIGRIVKAHGIRGEVAVALNAADPELLRGSVLLRLGRAAPKAYTVAGLRTHHGGLLVGLEGVADRTAAETLKGAEIFVTRDKLPPLEEGEVLLSDLVGLKVFQALENGEAEVGRIESVDIPAGQELWTIRTPDGKEVLFPAVAEFVREIDPRAGRALIAPPPGLLELYLGE